MAAPGIVADSSAHGLTAQLVEVWDALAELGAGVTDQEWSLPTPCPGWPISAQYAHVIGTESMLLGRSDPEVDPGEQSHVRNDIGKFNEVWVAALAAETREQVLARLAEVTGERKQALQAMGEEEFSAPSWTPVGKADYRRFMQIRVFDCWVHEQDVRDAVARPGHEEGPVAEQAVDEIVRALGYLVGKKAGAPEGTSVTVELTGPVHRQLHVSVIGRAQVVETLDGPATSRVELASGAFTRLACGRVDPEAVLGGALGGVRISGDEDLGRRLVSSLAFTI
jgi:uncharacterized protein (TIGR03083 family)